MKLCENRYGKQRVRVLKILRQPDSHSVKELTVSALLHGDFSGAHLADDNSSIVPTDTVKNTVNVLAKQELGTSTEAFALTLADHFLAKYPHIESADIEIQERPWLRMTVDGKPHPHAFIDRDQGTPFTSLVRSRGAFTLWSGITDLIVMKTTEAGFVGFPKCDLTTLKETTDRIVSTSMFARWQYNSLAADHPALNDKVLATMLKVFATEFSPSVQRTLFQMGEAALNEVPEIDKIEMKMPNKHYLVIDLKPFGLENANEVFVPVDEPHGEIEAIIGR
jgi:urate oxidase